MRKTVENFIFQIIFQIAKIVIPMITIPIVSKALGPEGVGIYNYTNSIAQYAVIFSGLGITLYGNREIAQNKENKIIKSQIFFDLVTLKLILTLFFLSLYYYYTLKTPYFLYFFAQSLIVIAVMFDISWYFMGMEDFKKVSMTSLMFQILSLFLIVKYINTSEDVAKYIFIQSVCLLFSQIFIWFFLKSQIVLVKPNIKRIKKHFFASVPYFVPQVAVLLYSNVNKTILGVFSTKEDVAFYSNAQTINNILITLITTLDTVLLPRMSFLSKKNDKKKMLKIMNKSIQFQLMISIPAFFGVLSIVPELVPWFFGEKFDFLIKIIPIMSVLIIVVPMGMSISRQYLLPQGKIANYNYSVIFGAVINIIISFSLIKIIGIYAAIISTICSEFFVTIIRLYNFKKEEHFYFQKVEILKIIISSVIMYFSIRIFSNTVNIGNQKLLTVCQILIGLLIYLLSIIIFRLKILREFREELS